MAAKDLQFVIRMDCFGMYNCGAGIFSNMTIRDVTGKGVYPDPGWLSENTDALIEDFLKYMNDPTVMDPKAKIPGVIAHYKGHHGYTKLPFWIFHDNVKGDMANPANPFTDLSALMSYLYDNQKKYGCVITRSHMADNIYHPPNGSHPGRVYVMTPPAIKAYVPGTKLSEEHKKGLRNCLKGYAHSMRPDDVETLKGLVGV